MSTPMFRTGRRKISPPFGGFTPAWGGEFSSGLFFVYAAQILRCPGHLCAEKKGIIAPHPQLCGPESCPSLDLRKNAQNLPQHLS